MNKKSLNIALGILSFIMILILVLTNPKSLLGYICLVFFLICLIYSLCMIICEEWISGDNPMYDSHHNYAAHNSKITHPTNTNPDSKSTGTTLNIDSVSKPVSQVPSEDINSPAKEQIISTNLPKTVELSDIQKELSIVQKISDQIAELTRQIKITEKNKTDAVTLIKEKNATLEAENKLQEKELQSLRDKLHVHSSLRALISIKKTCDDLSRTEKLPSSDETLEFIIDSINDRLSELDIHTIEFPIGTSLSAIPSEQIDTSSQVVPTQDEAQNNTIARSISPCYYLINDTKKIVVTKSVVSLYRFTPPSIQPQIS